MKRRVGFWLRRLADRVDYEGAPRCIGYGFTFEHGKGISFNEDGRGCSLWYMSPEEREKAFDESNDPPLYRIIDGQFARRVPALTEEKPTP